MHELRLLDLRNRPYELGSPVKTEALSGTVQIVGAGLKMRRIILPVSFLKRKQKISPAVRHRPLIGECIVPLLEQMKPIAPF